MIFEDPLKIRGELHLPVKDTIKMPQKPEKEVMVEELIQRTGHWRPCSEEQKVGPEMRSRELHSQWKEQLLENACLGTTFIKHRMNSVRNLCSRYCT